MKEMGETKKRLKAGEKNQETGLKTDIWSIKIEYTFVFIKKTDYTLF